MRLAPLASGLTLVLIASIPLRGEESPAAAFPHARHAEELSCADCHAATSASRSAKDNLAPDREACLACHEAEEVPASWPAVERELRFSHQYHLERLGLECSRCHAGVSVPGGRALPEMESCMGCHNGQAAPRECETCHEATRSALVPASHLPGWERQHGRQARLDDATCFPCHATADCQECHEGGTLVELAGPGDRQLAAGPELSGSAGQTVRRVHGLNFRFLHGLQARGKESDCTVCHAPDAGDFCADCHNPTRQLGVRPTWHGGAGWLTAGVGSGGGEHARLARRDLENCVACHDARGDDPTCVLCHVDRTPGKGNDPRTHAASFADDVGHGDFHDDDGAACFTCHARGPQSGEGFCGYCHGREED